MCGAAGNFGLGSDVGGKCSGERRHGRGGVAFHGDAARGQFQFGRVDSGPDRVLILQGHHDQTSVVASITGSAAGVCLRLFRGLQLRIKRESGQESATGLAHSAASWDLQLSAG